MCREIGDAYAEVAELVNLGWAWEHLDILSQYFEID